MISLTITMILILTYVLTEAYSANSTEASVDHFSGYKEGKIAELQYYENYEELTPNTGTVVVYPIFTQSAYAWKGFHDFYVGYCKTCLTVKIDDFYKKSLAAGGNGFRILEFLGYDIIDDIDIDKNPEILQQFDKVILLHNEFVTKNEFVAITQHPNVVYLYPNALSSEVRADYSHKTLTLIRGPGYPDPKTTNGFGWEFDNSEYFKDWECQNWEFYKIKNGHMLNCYPETQLQTKGYEILQTIKTL